MLNTFFSGDKRGGGAASQLHSVVALYDLFLMCAGFLVSAKTKRVRSADGCVPGARLRPSVRGQLQGHARLASAARSRRRRLRGDAVQRLATDARAVRADATPVSCLISTFQCERALFSTTACFPIHYYSITHRSRILFLFQRAAYIRTI